MKIMIVAFLQLLGLLFIGFPLHANPPGDDAEKGSHALVRAAAMSTARAVHQATLLESGEVLVSGGCNAGCNNKLASAEILVRDGGFTEAGSMAEPRAGHTATRLPDGRILVAGGWSNSGILDSAEIFNPETGRFTPTGSMNTVRAGHVAVSLQDGRVLLVGGQRATGESLDSVEIFDPVSGSFSAAGVLQVPRNAHAAVRLDDGRVLVTGGHSVRNNVLRSIEIHDPASGESELVGNMLTARHKHGAILLDDGTVLVVGGSGAGDYSERFASTEIFDPASGSVSPGPEMQYLRHKIVDALALLPGGKVLIAGGAHHPEIHDYQAAGMQSIAGRLDGEMMFATATAMPDGTVLIIGGYDEKIRSTRDTWIVEPVN